MGSVNSNAVLKVMGRGGSRGAPRGGIRGSRGKLSFTLANTTCTVCLKVEEKVHCNSTFFNESNMRQ